MLRQTSTLIAEFNAFYPKDFADSTAAARVNGYISGYGTIAQLQDELANLGLSTRGSQRLLELSHRYYR